MEASLRGSRLSLQQVRHWSFAQENQSAYLAQGVVLLEGPLVIEQLKCAVRLLVERYEILRTVFRTLPGMDVPMQGIGNADFGWQQINLEQVDEQEQQRYVQSLLLTLQKETALHINLQQGPNLTLHLLKLQASRTLLVVNMPVLCADAATLQGFVTELAHVYAESLRDEAIAEEPLQYADVAAWQYELFEEDEAEEHCSFWQHIDLTPIETCNLPVEKPERLRLNSVNTFRPITHAIASDPLLYATVARVARQLNVSVESVLLAGWQLFLSRLDNREEQITGVAYTGRSYEELEGALGLYTRVVPFATFVDATTTFGQLARQVAVTAREIEQRQFYFSWDRIEHVNSGRIPSGFAYLPYIATDASDLAVEDLHFELLTISSHTEPFILKLEVLEKKNTLQLQLHWDETLFAQAQIEMFALSFSTLLQQALNNIDTHVQNLAQLPPREETRLLQSLQGNVVEFPGKNVLDLFEEQVQLQPQALAVRSGEAVLSYQELNCWANRLGHVLRAEGVGADVLVGLCTQRSVEMLVGLLAILKAGGAYVALDPHLPESRLQYQLNDTRAPVVVVQAELQGLCKNYTGTVIAIEEYKDGDSAEQAANLHVQIELNNLVYVIYTSGSTGNPKGVQIQHGNISNYIQAMHTQLQWQPGWQFATVSTLAADLGNTVIFGSLITGGCLHILDYETVTSAQLWQQHLERYPIDVLKIVPSHLRALMLASETLENILPRKQLIVGGEALSRRLLAQIALSGSTCEIINHYGPTETTVGVLVNRLGCVKDEWKQESDQIIPIGRPLQNIDVAIVNTGGQLVPVGVAGELYIAGAGVAHGYLHQSELTNTKFVEMSWGGQAPKRFYRTGDIVRVGEDGNVEFIGRVDSQVKIRGYRVELGEIERAFNEHELVEECVVLLREDQPAEQRLVAYVVLKQRQTLEISDLTAFIHRSLPNYMLPAATVILPSLPLTPNGKIDTRSLPEPEDVLPVVTNLYEAPRNPIEGEIAAIWEEVLTIQRVSVFDNFFSLGGHSLLATQIISRIRATLGVELPILKLFEEPTVVGVAQRVHELLIQSQDKAEERPHALVAVSRNQPLELSFAQQRLWFLDQLDPGNIAYNKHIVLRLTGTVQVEALCVSLNEIVRRHESLRTIFATQAGQPVQIIQADVSVPLPVITLLEEEPVARGIALERLIKQCVGQPFDLARGPLLRTQLFKLGVQEHMLVLTMHHIVSDAWSNAIFMSELTHCYTALIQGEQPELPELSIQYADFAAWQRKWLQGPILEAHLQYWKKQLQDVTPLALPTDKPRPIVSSGSALNFPFTFSLDMQEGLQALSRSSNTTLFMTLLTAFQVLLARYSGQDDICVGSPIANRNQVETEELIGFFVNMLVLRSDLANNPGFKELLNQVRETTLRAFTHQDLPFEKIVEELQPDRNLTVNPLFQVSFSLQNTPVVELSLPGLVLSPQASLEATTKVDLELYMWETPEGLQGTLVYNTDLFNTPTIEKFIQHFEILLLGIIQNPEGPIGGLPLLTQATQDTLNGWNNGNTAFQVTTLVQEQIELQAANTPQALAVQCETGALTYAQLNRTANQLAHFLRTQQVGPESIVGICMQRSPEMFTALLAVLKAGGAYLPIDPDYPLERISYILQDADVQILLTQEHLAQQLADQVPLLLSLDAEWSQGIRYPDANLPCITDSENLAYVIYTSGSTGHPKGVQITQANLLQLIQWHQKTYNITSSDRATQIAGVAFDACAWEIWPYLTAGVSLYVPDERTRLDTHALLQWLEAQQITISFLPTPLAEQLLLEKGSTPTLRFLLTGGDALQRRPQAESTFTLVNHYGPTEATVLATASEVTSLERSDGRPPSIGGRVHHSAVYILDQHLQQVPVGVTGEIYIGGAGIGRGYQGRADVTAESFVPDRFARTGGQRLYRTGDLACYGANGQLEFKGRADDQVKVRGFRIELGEIRAVLAQYGAVRESTVIVRNDAMGQKQIIAYVLLHAGAVWNLSDARAFMATQLPEYMLPSTFVTLETLPLTPNGKIDYRALPAPDFAELVDETYVTPRNPLEEAVAEIWTRVLGIEHVSVHRNFFEAGGHSLLATRLVALLRTVLHVDMPLRNVFEHPTIAEQAYWMQHVGRKLSIPAIEPVERGTELPLSFAQQRLWFLDQLEPESAAYTIPIAVRIQGRLNIEALNMSLQKIVQRHESLRTSFAAVNDNAVQRISPQVHVHIHVLDMSRYGQVEQETLVQRSIQEQALQPFNLALSPLLRASCLKLSDQEHVFIMVVHHIVWDGWSMNVFMHELFTLYTAQIEGVAPILPALAIQYADYAIWQRNWLQGEVLAQQLTYWKQQLQGVEPLELPTDFTRPAVSSGRGLRQHIQLSRTLSDKLQLVSQREGVTQFMTLLAAFQILLAKYSHQRDISVGTPVANRGQNEIEQLIGLFVNTLVMRSDLTGDPTFSEMLQRVRETALHAYAHQDLPFEKIVEVLEPGRERNRAPLFQVMFVYQQALVSQKQPPALTITEMESEKFTAKFDLTLLIAETEQGLNCVLEYSTDLFTDKTIERFLQQWQTLLTSVVEDSEQPLSQISIVSEQEQGLFARWNATQTALTTDASVHQLFELQAERDPQAIAVSYRGTEMTYQELNQKANQLAHYLRLQHNVAADTLVGICIERSPAAIIAMLGVLKAGAAYVPLDPAYPADRLTFIINDAKVAVLLTCEDALQATVAPDTATAIVYLDRGWNTIAEYSNRSPEPDTEGHDLAYVIYTSGSTGTPKGVMVEHRNLSNLIASLQPVYSLTPQSRILQYMSMNFDVSVADIWMALVSGACLCLVPRDAMLPGENLQEVIQQSEATFGRFPPSVLSALAAEQLPLLETVITGGDRWAPDLIEQWGRGRTFVNEYGPTETTVLCTLALCTPEQLDVTIGRPLANVCAYILDETFQQVPIGVTGELYIGGAGVSRGYLERPALTAERFVPDRWSTQVGACLYRTGDLVRYRSNGEIEMLGRIDDQVKIRGFRIEPGEIEATINQHPAVRENVVLVRESVEHGKQLVAYLAVRSEEISAQAIRDLVGQTLPTYMVPVHVVLLATLPALPNGKVDRKALLALDITDEEQVALVAPHSLNEELVLACWNEVLGREHTSVLDNFFAIGGHSLLASQLVARLRTVFQAAIPLRMLFDAPTIVQQAQWIEQVRRDQATNIAPALVATAHTQDVPLSFEQQRLWFLHRLEPESIAYNMPFVLRLKGFLDVPVLEQSLTEVVRRHESLRTTFASEQNPPLQHILPASAVHIPLVTMLEQDAQEQEAQALQLVQTEIVRPFQLASEPLFRLLLVCLNEQEHILVLNMHHIISDGWSMGVIMHELITLYTAYSQHQVSPLEEPTLQYADYALWQRTWLDQGVLQGQLDYWKEALADLMPLNLPTDYPRPAIMTREGAKHTFLIPPTTLTGLQRLSRQEGVTLFMTALAAFQLLLANYSQQDDIVVGTVSAHRTHRELESLIGFFINTLPIRTQLQRDWSFRQLLQCIRETMLNAYEHQDVPFEHIVDAVKATRDLSISPIFQVLFVFQNAPFASEGIADLEMSVVDAETYTAKFDLSLTLAETVAGLSASFEYSTELFSAETIQNMSEYFQQLLAEIVGDPQHPIGRYHLLTENDQLLLNSWHNTEVSLTSGNTLSEGISLQAERTPLQMALVSATDILNYAQLEQRANQLAHYLQQQGVGTESRVGLCMERGVEMVVCMLAILKAGGAYVPLDLQYPADRLQWIQQDAQIVLLLTQESLETQLAQPGVAVLCVDRDAALWAGEPVTAPACRAGAENLAYLIYTSGSTGRPKGVMVTHRSAVSLIAWARTVFSAEELQGVLASTSICFDLSVFEIFVPLSCGGTVIIAENALDLPSHPQRQLVTLINTVPSAATELVRQRSIPERVQTINLAGEALAQTLVAQLEQFPQIQRIYNLYGPSEDTTYSTFALVTGRRTVVPIGSPVDGTQAYVLDADLQQVPIGVIGELYLGGAGLARGYLGRPDLTAERFLPDCFATLPGARIYRTGDLVRYNRSGALEFLGRTDQQVKIRGFRIELGEIEVALRQHPAVQDVVLVVNEESSGNKRLVAYIVYAGEEQEQVLRLSLQKVLPAHMIPSVFVGLDVLPLTPNGKVDRKALPVLEVGHTREKAFVAPRTVEEETLVRLWSQVLGIEHISVEDNFFSIGGDSILSLQIVSRAREIGLHLTPRQLFAHQTIAELAGVLEHSDTLPGIKVEQEPVSGEVPLTPIQQWFFAQQLPEPHHWNQAFMLSVKNEARADLMRQAFEVLLQHHDILRARFSNTNGVWSQQISALEEERPVAFTVVDLADQSAIKQQQMMEYEVQQTHASLHLEKGPGLHAVWFNLGNTQEARLLIVIHHLLVDGVSWRILLEDLQTAYQQLAAGQAVHLPDKTTSFQHWSQQLQTYAQSSEVIAQVPYWLEQTEHVFHHIPLDQAKELNTVVSVRHVQGALTKEETRALLQDVPAAFHTQMNDVLLTALTLALLTWTGERALFVNMESHGREELHSQMELSRTVGWFTSLYPVLLDLRAQGASQPLTALRLIKEQLRRVPRRGTGYGALRYQHSNHTHTGSMQQQLEQLKHGPTAEISFNYLGQFDQGMQAQSVFGAASESSGLSQHPANLRAHILDVTASILDGVFHVDWSYSENCHRTQTIERLTHNFMQRLRQLITLCQDPANSGYTPSDFPLAALKQEQIDQLLRNKKQVEAIYPLSPLQQGLLFHSLYEPDGGDHIIQTCFTIDGPLQVDAFEQAWQKVCERHSILRTSFVWEGLNEPLQVVENAATIAITHVDWQHFTSAEQQEELNAYLNADRFQGFPLAQAPLLRLLISKLAAEQHQIVWSYHHLLLDGWSIPLLLNDLFTCYEAFASGHTPTLGRVRSYQDYILWLQQQNGEEADAFWREKLQGFTAPNELSFDHSTDEVRETGYGKCHLKLAEDVTAGLQGLASQKQLTLNALVQGAWSVLLSRYTGDHDIVFGATVAGRPAEVPDIEGMIGLFINTLPIRVQFTATTPIVEVCHSLQAYHAEVSQYEFSPLVRVQRQCSLLPGTPLFESLVVFENYPVSTSMKEQTRQKEQLRIQFTQTVEQTNYPLMLEILPHKELFFQLSYARNRFSAAFIDRLLKHLQIILEDVLAHPEHIIGEIPLLTVEEKQHLLFERNQTHYPYKFDVSLHHLILQQARLYPTSIALVCGQTKVTYGQLQERATQLAHRLRSLSVGADCLVGLYMPRSIEMVIGMLATFQAGGAYLPLDMTTPKGRLEAILEEAKPHVLLTYAHLRDQLPVSKVNVLCLNPSWQDLAQESSSALADDTNNQRLAYVIYTSGSTGRPKGVMVTQKGMLNHLFIKIDELDLTEYDRIAQTASHCFDISVWQIFAGLLVGAQVHILPDEIAHDPENLAAVVEREHLSILEVVPSLLRAMIETLKPERLNVQMRHLRWLIATGEALPADICRRWCQISPVALMNAYGPTECSDDVTHLIIDEPPARHLGVMPIGKALANTSLYLLDEGFQPVPIGIAAQLYIGGTGVGRGYLCDPQRTAHAFIPNPFSGIPGDRMYRTGDLARFCADGTVEFVGRVDYQVKVRGFRIELGEVEAALQQHTAISECVVLAREDVPGRLLLVAYIVCTDAEKPATEELKYFLREYLPAYMVPGIFIVLPVMPLTANGKIDRRALPLPEEQDYQREEQDKSALRPTEELLTNYWCEVLLLDHVGIHDNFFELGGHSLLATRLISRIRAAFQVEIMLKNLFELPTIAGLAEKIEQLLRADQRIATPPLVPMTRTNVSPLSFAQQRLWFIDQLEPNNTAYTIPLALHLMGTIDLDALVRSLQEIVRRHEILRTSFAMQDEQPVQIVHPAEHFQVRQLNISALQSNMRESLVRQLAKEETLRPFDLAESPLLRATLVSYGTREAALLITMHHIVSDGWSMGVFLHELGVLYNAFSNGKLSPLPHLPVQYADVALWERIWLKGDILQQHIDYWRQQLSGFTQLQLATDHVRPAVQTNSGAIYQFDLPSAVAEALQAISRQEDVTLFMTLLSVFQIVLQRYAEQDDIVIGTDIAGRNRAEVEDLIGFFVNQIVLRANLAGGPTFRDLIRQNRVTCMGAYIHQDVPFEKLVEELKPQRDMAPFFQIKFLLQNLPTPSMQSLPDITAEVLAPEITNAKLDIVLQITPGEHALHCLFTYNADLFDVTTIMRMAEHFKVLVLSALANPDASIATLDMLTQEEREQQQSVQKQREQSAFKKFKSVRPRAISVKLD